MLFLFLYLVVGVVVCFFWGLHKIWDRYEIAKMKTEERIYRQDLLRKADPSLQEAYRRLWENKYENL